MPIQINPNVVILNEAWAKLWDPSSKYYIPTVLANGGTFGTTTIPPLQTLALPDPPSYPLYSSSTWGDVDISLSGMTLSGIPGVTDRNFTPSDDASTITGTIAFTQLELSGNYEVDGSGIAGCAMDVANSAASPPPPLESGEGADTTTPSNMTLAAQYRDQLVAQGGNGITLVSTYYDHNDTINAILNDPNGNAFTAAWPNYEQTPGSGLNTAYFMRATNAAAQSPDELNPDYPSDGVGQPPYNFHALYMKAMLIKTAFDMAGPNPDPENPYVLLANSTALFSNAVTPLMGPSSVNTVMTAVQNTPPPSMEQLQTVPETDLARRAREMAERDYPMWKDRAAARAAAQALQTTTFKSSGQFDFQFPMPTITFNGTVTVSGIAPQQTLTVNLTSLSAAVPRIDIVLLTGSDPNFTQDAQSQINDAQWFQTTVGTKVNAALNGASLLNTVSNIFNQALLEILSSPA